MCVCARDGTRRGVTQCACRRCLDFVMDHLEQLVDQRVMDVSRKRNRDKIEDEIRLLGAQERMYRAKELTVAREHRSARVSAPTVPC